LALRGKEDKKPQELIEVGEQVVVNGFCNPIKMLCFGLYFKNINYFKKKGCFKPIETAF